LEDLSGISRGGRRKEEMEVSFLVVPMACMDGFWWRAGNVVVVTWIDAWRGRVHPVERIWW
jgi:hypothetical protein